jgi:signal transduction histidine kinase
MTEPGRTAYGLKEHLASFGRKESFALRVFKIFFVIFAAVSIVFTLFYVEYETERARHNLEDKGRMIAAFLAKSVSIGVFVENRDILEDAVAGVMSQGEVLSVYIWNADGKELLVKNRPSAGQRSEDKGPRMEFVEPVVIEQQLKSEEALYFDAKNAQPEKAVIGKVSVVLDSSIFTRAAKTIARQTILIFVVFIVIGSVLLFVAIRRVLKPLTLLTTEVRMLGEGKEIEKVTVESSDEIGRLAEAFNTMTENLKKRDEEARELERQLRHSQKMDAVGTLARGIAHDFNNILTTVQASLYAMQKKMSKEDSLYNYVFRMDNSVAKAKSLVQGLLAFGKGQGAKSYPVDIGSVVDRMIPTIESMAGEQTACRIVKPDGPLVVMADSVQMKQVILNLVANARDAMPGGGTLTILMNEATETYDSCIPRRGRFALLSVSDTGHGIDEKIKERVFEPFFTTKEVGKGTGLGLSIVYGIVEQHQGHICINSTPDGTEFRIYMPMQEASEAAWQQIDVGGINGENTDS